MALKDTYGDVATTRLEGHIVQCEIQRPPNNFFDIALINDLSDKTGLPIISVKVGRINFMDGRFNVKFYYKD